MDGGPEPFQLDIAALSNERQGHREVAFLHLGFHPADATRRGEMLDLVGQAGAQTLPSIRGSDADQTRGSILIPCAVLPEPGFGPPDQPSAGSPGTEPQPRLIGGPQRIVEAQLSKIVLPVSELVDHAEPRGQVFLFDRPDRKCCLGLGHDGLKSSVPPPDLSRSTVDPVGSYALTDPSASSRMSRPRSTSCSLAVSGNNKRMTLS